jgi:hypothetical protein
MRLRLRNLPAPRPRISAGELPHGPGDALRIPGIERAGQRLLPGGVMPLWPGAGRADWHIRRRTRIQDTAGARESVIHALMFAEAGVPVLPGLFCEVNAGVLLSAYGAAGVHGATAYRDQVYAQPRRRVDPAEQHVHSLLEAPPGTAAFSLTALHWDQARALTGRGRPDFGVRSNRRDPLPVPARVRLLAAVTAFGILPPRRGAMAVLADQAGRPAPAGAGRPGHPDPSHPARRRHPAPRTAAGRNRRRRLINHSSTPDYGVHQPAGIGRDLTSACRPFW